MRALLKEINHMQIEEKLFYIAGFIVVCWLFLKLVVDGVSMLIR